MVERSETRTPAQSGVSAKELVVRRFLIISEEQISTVPLEVREKKIHPKGYTIEDKAMLEKSTCRRPLPSSLRKSNPEKKSKLRPQNLYRKITAVSTPEITNSATEFLCMKKGPRI